LALAGDEWSTSCLDHFTPGEGAPAACGIGLGWAQKVVWVVWSRGELLYPAGNETKRSVSL